MARAHLRYQLPDRAGNQVQGAAVWLFAVDTGVVTDPATGTAITGSMYALRAGGSAIANPLISNDKGEVEAWLDTPQTMDAVVTRNGGEAHYPGNSAIKLLFDPFKEVVHAYHDPADVGAGGGGGAPTTAPYVTTAADAGLSAEKVLGTDVIMAGAEGSRPAASIAGRLWFSTDTAKLYRDTGSAWTFVGATELADLTERSHGSLTGVTADQHHAALHAALHAAGQTDELLLENLGGAVVEAQIPGTIARTSQLHAQLHSIIDAAHHNGFPGGTTDFLRADGTFAAPPGGGGGAPADAQYLVLAANGTLTDERVLTPGTGLDITDGGAGQPATLDVDSSEFTAETAPAKFDDTVHIRDASTAAERKMAISNLFNPRNGLEFSCDFLFFNALSGGENIGEFEAGLSGTGAGFSLGTGDQSHPGVQQASTGTTSSGGVLVNTRSSALRLGGGKARMTACIKTGPNLSSSSERYDIQCGFVDSGLGDSTDGVYLRYSDDINAGKWQLIAVSNGVSTVVDTGITVAADTWYTLEVEVNADGTSAEAFINGTSVGTVATNIPTAAGRETGAGCGIWKSVGTTARTMDYDMVRLALDFTTAR